MTGLFEPFVDKLLKIEGGYVNDPHDAGGETNGGITVAVARRFGYMGPMKDLPRETQILIYRALYWDSMLLDDIGRLSPLAALELADTAVNQGVARAGEYLQRTLNVLNKQGTLYPDLKVDGAIGKKTVLSLASYIAARPGQNGQKVLLSALNCLQGEFYIGLAERRQTDEDFIYGWLLNRIS